VAFLRLLVAHVLLADLLLLVRLLILGRNKLMLMILVCILLLLLLLVTLLLVVLCWSRRFCGGRRERNIALVLGLNLLQRPRSLRVPLVLCG
jgi:hypothetical protein